ncbi:MAG: hypothetical protein ABH951_00030 [Patescibacteria group bacterium]
MKNSEINIVYVRVDRDREKIWKICRLAMLQKNFNWAGLFHAFDEEGFEEIMKQCSIARMYILIINKNEEELYWRRLMKPKSEMKSSEIELDFEKAMEWLIDNV